MRTLGYVLAILFVAGGVIRFVDAHRHKDDLDTRDFDRKVKAWAEATAPVDKVSCSEVELKKGNTFSCQVDLTHGKSYMVEAEIMDDDGLVHYNWQQPIVDAEKLAADVASAMKTAANRDVTVDCGKGVVEVPPGGFQCTASSGADHGHVRVKQDPKTREVIWATEP
jgi:hypothetical protein